MPCIDTGGILSNMDPMSETRLSPTSQTPAPPRMVPPMPARAGVGFKAQHLPAILDDPGRVGWFEVHAENYMVDGGPRLRQLEILRESYPLSLHGVGLSLGGAEPLDRDHLAALRRLVDRFDPALVSEHVAWSVHDGNYFADLLPVPMNKASLDRLVAAVSQVQDVLGRAILIENPSSYLDLPESNLVEIDLLTEVARRSGCGLLIDVNNIFVSAQNLKSDAAAYIDAVPADLVGEIHLAGHETTQTSDGPVLIDSHSRQVDDAVWGLYRRLLDRIGPRPTLIEWDNDLPDWPVLAGEAALADALLTTAAKQPEPVS